MISITNAELNTQLYRKMFAEQEKAKRSHLSVSAYLRKLINGVIPREAPPPDFFSMMQQLHYIGNNLNQSYLEEGLPPFLRESVDKMVLAWKKKESEGYLEWDCDYCNLQSDINIAEVENLITSEQAWYLREKYLYLQRPGELD